ncbi:MAG: molybdate ABC transporter substrate-binding protein [Candidatus Rokubacteria bacterium]|nr:molybdate ABC transporter substrate-binding protein [Candidatus Rokubacteria bacterium]
MRAVLLALVLLTAAPVSAQELALSVAVSMKEATEEIGRVFTKTRPGVTMRYNVGASGDLQKQIEAGAPVDVFVSAAARQMDELEGQRLIVTATRRAFARNTLVAIAPGDSTLDLSRPATLLGARVTRIAIGNPKTVPAGQYTEESLRALGLWDGVRGKLVYAENVRQVLDYVNRGEVDAGFVYATDAATRAGRVKEVFRPAPDTYRPVVYPVAVIEGARQPALAAAFVELLAGAEGQAILRRLGFAPPPPGSR